MKMRHDEVRVSELPIEGGHAQHDPGQARDEELEQEADAKQHRCPELDLASPHGGEPVEDLDAGRHGDRHGGQHEERVRGGPHADREHVMRPHAHGDEPDRDRRRDHDRVAEDGLAREHRNDLRGEGECGDDEHVNFGVAKHPEEVHPDDRRAARLRVEEVPAEVTIDE